MTAISDRILADNDAVLGRMLNHPFVQRIGTGTLPAQAWHRYLVYEGAFVETAISIFACATAKAPDMDSKRWLIGVQHALVHDQIPYFDESFAALGVDTTIPIPPSVRVFDDGMHAIARDGDFAGIVTAMFAAEWMYWTWCSRAATQTIADPHIRRWIELHADDGFAAQARWLKDSIDRVATPADLPRLSAIFARVTGLEIAFHDAPLMGVTEPSDA